MFFCPWCGIKLPKDLGSEYFDILRKEYRIAFLDVDTRKAEKSFPQDFESDAWWKKRGL